MSPERTNERGLTLTELTIAMVLAAIVVVGVVGFYMNSQATWFDASTQVITQREGTVVLESIARQARGAQAFTITYPGGDTTQSMLQVTIPDSVGTHDYYFWWEDSLIHEGSHPVNDDRGALLQSKVERFVVTANGTMVNVQNLQVVSSQGQRLNFSTSFARRLQ